ncbi:hypothetical protein [Nonomuraea ceibae]|uniref:hypothetical protein n=1 Tax=Nonomuraea ceibae TaxID=1935170 RepID=UPI001C5F9340|nr:hypothetical protein [Nonomuraea ceibae]
MAQTIVTTDLLDLHSQAELLAAYPAGLSRPLLADLIAFQAVRGWRWAALHEQRHLALWRARLRIALGHPAHDG